VDDVAGGGDDEAVLAWPHAPPTVARATVSLFHPDLGMAAGMPRS
jgi:hypothetical protein